MSELPFGYWIGKTVLVRETPVRIVQESSLPADPTKRIVGGYDAEDRWYQFSADRIRPLESQIEGVVEHGRTKL
ncbi:MAG: hypothetical protein IIV27_01555 [Clostridia bacterium]|nr:hypothetical protein [Clostridia bacterium]